MPGTAISFENGGAFHADVPIGTPPAAGVDTLAIGSPTCGLAAPITIASSAVVTPLASSGAATGPITATARQTMGSPNAWRQAAGPCPQQHARGLGSHGDHAPGRPRSGDQTGGHDSARHRH